MSLYGILGVQFFGTLNHHCVRNGTDPRYLIKSAQSCDSFSGCVNAKRFLVTWACVILRYQTHTVRQTPTPATSVPETWSVSLWSSLVEREDSTALMNFVSACRTHSYAFHFSVRQPLFFLQRLVSLLSMKRPLKKAGSLSCTERLTVFPLGGDMSSSFPWSSFLLGWWRYQMLHNK